MKSTDGSSRRRFSVSRTYAAFISPFERHSCFATRFPSTSEYHSGWSLKCADGGKTSKNEW